MIGPQPFRVIVTGTRHNGSVVRDAVYRELDEVWAEMTADPRYRGIVVVHGQCKWGGADAYADAWTYRFLNARPERHPASGHAGPPARNTHMVGLGADLCLGFPTAGSRGTWDCLRKAVDAGIPVRAISVSVDATGEEETL